MEITNSGVSGTALTSQAPIVAAASASGGTATKWIAPAASAYTPSAEFVRLLDQARAQPAVRTDRVQAAAVRLQQGYYHTSASIAQTADAMVHDGD